jgi:anti-sigma factor RsiW
MIQAECEAVREELDAWALGALDAEDLRRLERHLVECSACTEYADIAQETAGAIAFAVPLHAASSSLKAKVIAGAAVLQEVPSATRVRARRSWWPAAAAAAVIAAVGFGGWVVYGQRQIDDLEDENAVLNADATAQSNRFATVNTQLLIAQSAGADAALATDAVTDIVDQPDAVRLALEGTDVAPEASGRYVWSRMAGKGVLVANDLAVLPSDQLYCLWLIYESDWVLGGQFSVAEDGTGRLVVDDLELPPDSGPLQAFAVSIEPAGDVTKHTGDTVLRAEMQR